MLREPKLLIVVNDGNIILLNCEFNTYVNCTWTKNRFQMNVDDYYYDRSKRGHNTKDCSIILENVSKEVHEGNWTCSNIVQNETSKSLQSKVAEVKVKGKYSTIDCKKKLNEKFAKTNVAVDKMSYNEFEFWTGCCNNNESITSGEFPASIKNDTTIINNLISEDGNRILIQSTVSTSSTGFIVTIVILMIIIIAVVAYVGFRQYEIKQKKRFNLFEMCRRKNDKENQKNSPETENMSYFLKYMTSKNLLEVLDNKIDELIEIVDELDLKLRETGSRLEGFNRTEITQNQIDTKTQIKKINKDLIFAFKLSDLATIKLKSLVKKKKKSLKKGNQINVETKKFHHWPSPLSDDLKKRG
ncbi:hypothetical protein CHUAL_006204 [Chamberlinius hualienensis]